MAAWVLSCRHDAPRDEKRTPPAPAISGAKLPGASGGAGASALAPSPAVPLSGDGVFVCTNKDPDHVTQRVALPNGDAYVISRDSQGTWATSDGQHLEDAGLRALELAFRQHGFFDLPQHADADSSGSREWDLRFASASKGHHSTSYGPPPPAFREIFSACERAFAPLPTTRSDVTTALGIYRTLEEYAQSLTRPDLRRQMLLEWLDALQSDLGSP
jgi:hypothetical protein